jgi:predicted nucleotidyltransferase
VGQMRAILDPAEAAQFAAAVIRRHIPDPCYRVFVFGSRATGSAPERSDIDIGIEGPAPVPRSALAAIQDELEEAPTLYTIDVVDFACVPEKFRRVARHRMPL